MKAEEQPDDRVRRSHDTSEGGEGKSEYEG